MVDCKTRKYAVWLGEFPHRPLVHMVTNVQMWCHHSNECFRGNYTGNIYLESLPKVMYMDVHLLNLFTVLALENQIGNFEVRCMAIHPAES